MSASIPLTTRFTDWVVPQLKSSDCFGPSIDIVSCGIDPNRQGEDQFSSTVQFFEIGLQTSDDVRKINVVVKFQPESEVLRESLRAKEQFENEVLMYSEVLPLIDRDGIVDDIFCKYYHGLANPESHCDQDYVVLEDLSKKGYKLTDEKVFLDYEHCILALKQVGKFHALSYAAKKDKHEELQVAISRIKEKWNDDRKLRWRYILSLCGERGVLPLIKNGIHSDLLKAFLKNYDDPVKFYSSLVDPIEHEAVLCHGDFCRNNMLFAYDDAGKPKSVKFFDLQTPRYSSPVIDLSFFLLMNTTKETREKHWDEFLTVYKESVKTVIPHIDIPELDFERVGIYGYLHSSFFLPIMLAEKIDEIPLEVFLSLSPYEQGANLANIGGERETNFLVDIVKFLLCKGYIHGCYKQIE